MQPTLLKWSGLRFVDRDVEECFVDLVAETLEMREKNNIVREDFLQLLLELHNDGHDDIDEEKLVTEKNEQLRG